MNSIRILMVGDVVGTSGRTMFQKHIQKIKVDHDIDAIVVNGENCSNGRGITSKIVRFFKHNHVNVVTSGNHIWANKEIYNYIADHHDLLRPANFPTSCPGVGVTTFDCKGFTVGVVNIQGRVFMKENLDCPFRTMDSILTFLRHQTNLIVVDVHAETTSEKMALAHYLDGKVSAVVGTHTHVQTADERLLPKGTAFITDLGMVGSLNGMLGMQKEQIIENFLTQMPVKFVVDVTPPFVLSGVWIDVDTKTGKAVDIQRIRVVDNDMKVTEVDEKNQH